MTQDPRGSVQQAPWHSLKCLPSYLARVGHGRMQFALPRRVFPYPPYTSLYVSSLVPKHAKGFPTYDLHKCSPFCLQCPCVSSLHPSPLTLALTHASPPNLLVLGTIPGPCSLAPRRAGLPATLLHSLLAPCLFLS